MYEAKQREGGADASVSQESTLDFQSFWQKAWRPSQDVGSYRLTRVEGEVPREIHGTLYRNGPSQNVLPESGAESMHLFDGDALIHAFRFDDGEVHYTGRFVETPQFLAEKAAGRLIMPLLGADVTPVPPNENFPIRQQPNTNVVHHGGRLMALVENSWPFEIDERDLGPKGPVDFGGCLLGMSVTAHPRIDGRTGEMVIHGYQPFEPYLHYYEMDAGGACKVAEPIDLEYPAMMHDLAISENYAILPVAPIVFHAEALIEGRSGISETLTWEPERGLRFAVRPRGKGSEIRWFTSPTPGFMFHPGNAYEEDGKIYMDACTYEDGGQLIKSLELFRKGMGLGLFAVPYLYIFDLATGECTAKKLDERGAEFPRLDDRRVGYKNRYGYAWRQDYGADGTGRLSTIVKYDRTGKPSTAHDFGKWQWPGEPVFVPRSPEADEDDGFVLVAVYDGLTDGSYLAVLDARNMADEPLAKLHIEHRIPNGFHGNFAAGVV